MSQLKNRIEQHIEMIATYTATPGNGTTRLTYSKEDLQTRNYLKEQMQAAGLTVKEDGFGNIFGKLEGSNPDAPSVLIGSHFDSVPNGGAYDGPAGVVAALEVANLFQQHNIKPTYPLEIVALVEEEGSRFGGGLMGSRGITGLLREGDFYQLQDKDGISPKEAMQDIGLDPSLPKMRDPKTMKAFLELHIEQGPILEEKNIPIGVVESIVGLTQYEITVKGQAGHAGTTPMDKRSDALITAAKIVSTLPDFAIKEGNGTVLTTGQLNVFPNGSNVIPDKVIFTVDIRSGEEENVRHVINQMLQCVDSHQGNGIEIDVEEKLYIQPKALSETIRNQLKKQSENCGITFCSINSGAGHDAMVFSDVTDVGMLFIPSKAGLSHCPEEWSDVAHIANAVEIFYETAKQLTEAK
ncbi:N-carbamoyl-L-amino-acid hydrolase [Paraliobacillus ryukyuensis]|uniref:Allantoate deiminase n=1 Tax=Paraliobacillus ryukyuensis TaxID=200904 RepID=A0A366E488_9BACI|nr:Zn-dependent hydrolase [Paraliobacillus ryukyuensis]RBO97132.1 allantoate deiminase [Paraliobacillus ryukyuensis]